MGFFILPIIIGIVAFPNPEPGPDQFGDFARLRAALQQPVYVIDSSGQERRLVLVDATAQAASFRLGGQSIEMSRDAVVSIDRARDGNRDGIVKGVAIGLFLGLTAEAALGNGGGRYVLTGAMAYGALGYMLDRGNVARQPLYRAPAASVTVRF